MTEHTTMYHLRHINGDWQGVNKLRILPTDPFAESEASLKCNLIAHDNYALMTYTWADKGEPQDGVLLLESDTPAGDIRAIWGDSWHQTPQWMELKGRLEDGIVRLTGTYSAQDEACSWRIAIDVRDQDRLAITMDNVMPSKQYDYKAVEANYNRHS